MKANAHKRLLKTGLRTALAGALICAAPMDCIAQDATAVGAAADDLDSLLTLDLEDLMNVQVTSVAGVATAVADTPAAIFVISNEDIRRGGHRTIMDALRMVPGVNVGQTTSNIWAISSRGFNGRFADKLLVLVDGRAVYNDLFAGTWWDSEDVLLEDVDRIEVIRGPGATLWGANAVNGVVNVVTKSAKDTQGLYITAGGGSEERGFGAVRYGFQVGDNAWLRLYTKYFDRDGFQYADHSDVRDTWNALRGGFRLDIEGDDDLWFTLQGDAYRGNNGEPQSATTLTPPFSELLRGHDPISGFNVLGRLSRDVDTNNGWSLQAYIDYAKRDTQVFDNDRTTADIEFRHRFELFDTHRVMWGFGYRNRSDDTSGSLAVSFVPASRTTDKFSAFVQDSFPLIGDQLSMMVGSKFEYNDYTGFEVQPSARLIYTPDESNTFWGAVSRAVRTPARHNDGLRLAVGVIPPPLAPTPTPIIGRGFESGQSEELIAFEGGYRAELTDNLSVDVTGFYNDYENLFIFSTPLDATTVPFINDAEAESYGFEVAARWRPADNWRLSGGYSWLRINSHGFDETTEGDQPDHQFNIRSYLDITEDLEFNAAGYFVDNVREGDISSYFRADLGLTWRPNANTELSVWVQNLLDEQHPEFSDSIFVGPTVEVERSIFAQVSFRF